MKVVLTLKRPVQVDDEGRLDHLKDLSLGHDLLYLVILFNHTFLDQFHGVDHACIFLPNFQDGREPTYPNSLSNFKISHLSLLRGFLQDFITDFVKREAHVFLNWDEVSLIAEEPVVEVD